MITMPRPFSTTAADAPDAPLSTSRLLEHEMLCQSNGACDALPVRRGLQASPAEAVEDRLAESFWLKEAKAALRSRDPVDAANDVEVLARWADLQCGDILQTSTATLQGDQNG